MVFLSVRWIRHPDARKDLLPRFLLFGFSLAVLSCMILRTWSLHYGFVLLPVPLATFAVFWFSELPGWLRQRRFNPVFAAAGTGLFCALIAGHYRISKRFYDLHTAVLDTPRGHLLLIDNLNGVNYGTYYAETVQFLSRFPKETRVLVIPDGVGLTFLAE